MSSLSFTFPSLHHYHHHHHLSSLRPTTTLRPITATSTDPTITPTPTPTTNLPLKPIPGSYGLPILQPLKDRFEYFYNPGGRDEYFKSRILKHNSTVFRTNMPPGPFISHNPNVIVLLDAKSFPTLFDLTKVHKQNLFTGTYSPSTSLTGNHRVLSYLDPSEPMHTPLKTLIFFMLQSSRNRILHEFQTCYNILFNDIETELAQKGKSLFNNIGEQTAFRFLTKAYFSIDPEQTLIGKDGPRLISIWVLFNLAPILRLGLPWFLEEPLLHTFRLPTFLVKKSYYKLYEFFETCFLSSLEMVEEAEGLGISKEEAVHNILFAVCFNTFGGIKILFPNLLKWIGRAGTGLHARLSKEIRGAIMSYGGGKVTTAAMENMPLMKSVVYEVLRIEPPVALQYGKAKHDLMIESHDAVFEVKEGEMLFGYQPFATKDPRVFERAEEFVPDRFIGEGEELLKYVLWSNGPETESPTVRNKQCAGKDFVVLITRMFVVELFRRYDSFDIVVATSPLGSKVTLTSLKRARV